MNQIVSLIFIGIVLIYRKTISPFFPPTCRYQPTCSTYVLKSIKKHGPWKGGLLSIKRVCSCHPFGGEGRDPVP